MLADHIYKQIEHFDHSLLGTYQSPIMRPFRLDRALSVGLFNPVSNLLRIQHRTRVPILMYHGVSSALGNRHPYFETRTSPELFAEHMRYLRDEGYTTVDLNEALEAILTGRNGAKRVAITFDDGLRNFYTNAFPLLAEYHFKATMFLVSGFTDDQSFCHDGKEYLTWHEVREICSQGIRVGSHTVSHPELYRLRPSGLELEIVRSKEVIEDKLGEPIRSFSYPFAFPEHDGRFVERLRDLLQTHGYEEGVTTIIGTANNSCDWFFLPRLPVNNHDDLRFFKAKLEGGYDWLHRPQLLSKKLRQWMSKSTSW